MARTGRPRLPAHLRQKCADIRALKIESFYNFCALQEQRLRQSVAGYCDTTHCLTADDIMQAYRTETLGPALHAKEDLVEMIVRR